MSENLSTSLDANQKYCLGCAKRLHISALSCPECGAVQKGGYNNFGKKSRIAAIFLALILGGIGAHKFYLGQVGLGVLYLLFFWTFIPAIISLVELVIYITMTDELFAEKYG